MIKTHWSAALLVMATGCATRTMIRMEPAPALGQDVKFKNGTPIVFSPGSRFDVVVSPKAGPSGRYELGDQIGVLVGVYNHSGRRVEVSESNIVATGNKSPARVLRAAEIEDSVIKDAAWAQFSNSVAGYMQQVATSKAGTTTFSGNTSFFGTAGRAGQINPVRIEGASHSEGTSYNEGAVMQAQRQAAMDTAANARGIRSQEEADLSRVATVFQRNTLEPEERYLGAVILEPPRKSACAIVTPRTATTTGYARTKAGPCRLQISVVIDGEAHVFEFNEYEASKLEVP